MSKREDERRRWIEETQRFQRIAGVVEDTEETLGQDWDNILLRRSARNRKVKD